MPDIGRPARAAAIAAAALAAILAAGWLHLSYTPNSGKDIYDNEAAFAAYVAGLGLASMSFEQARSRLAAEGFRCDMLSEDNASCSRRLRGSSCGELQSVDLKMHAADGALHSVTTRFGLTCR